MTSFPSVPDTPPPPRPNTVGAPVNPVFILKTGQVIPIALQEVKTGVWRPVIDGELTKLLPLVIGLDADDWPKGATLRFPRPPGVDAQQWTRRLLDNSPCLKTGSVGVSAAGAFAERKG